MVLFRQIDNCVRNSAILQILNSLVGEALPGFLIHGYEQASSLSQAIQNKAVAKA